jgi:hypothetical protein
MFILGRAHQSHPAKHVLDSAVGGGWPLSQAQPWVANKSTAQPGSPCAGRQTPEGGRPWPGLTRPGPVRLARPAAATLTNTPLDCPQKHADVHLQKISYAERGENKNSLKQSGCSSSFLHLLAHPHSGWFPRPRGGGRGRARSKSSCAYASAHVCDGRSSSLCTTRSSTELSRSESSCACTTPQRRAISGGGGWRQPVSSTPESAPEGRCHSSPPWLNYGRSSPSAGRICMAEELLGA